MKLTDVRIRKTLSEGKMRAVVSITLDNELAVHDLRIIAGNDREFVAMPSRKVNDGSYRDIVHPISAEFREDIERQIIERYHEELEAEAKNREEIKVETEEDSL